MIQANREMDGRANSLMRLQLKKAFLWQFNVTGNTKMYVGFPIKCPNKQSKFPTDFHKSPTSNFTEICPVGAVLIYAIRWTDRHDKVNRHFSRLCKWLGRLHLSVHTFERLIKYGIGLVVYTNDCVKKN